MPPGSFSLGGFSLAGSSPLASFSLLRPMALDGFSTSLPSKQISLDRSSDEGAGCQLQASHPAHAAAAVAQASRTSARPAAEDATASAAIATITFTLVTTSSDPLVSSGPEVAVVLEDPLEVF